MLATGCPTTVPFLTGSLRPCNVRSNPRRGEMMTEKVRLEVLTTPSNGDGVRRQIEKTIESNRKNFDFVMKQIPHMESAVETLQNGHGDLLAMSAHQWKDLPTQGLSIVGVLPRREPTWVLVSEDKPEYLLSKAIVVCDNVLLRRQMRRLRADLNLMTSEAFAQHISNTHRFESLEREDRIHWLEEMRQDEVLDGYIVSRGEHAELKFKSRRHTLGLQRENPERTHFVPPPLHGFTLLVARNGFPSASVQIMCDNGAFIAHRMEVAFLASIGEELHPITGIFVEQRKISAILREANRSNDEQTLDGVLDIEKNIKTPGPRLEMRIETLNHHGTVTAGAERVCPVEESHMGMVNVLKEFQNLLEMMQMGHDEIPRQHTGLSEEFSMARPGLLDLSTIHSVSSEEE